MASPTQETKRPSISKHKNNLALGLLKLDIVAEEERLGLSSKPSTSQPRVLPRSKPPDKTLVQSGHSTQSNGALSFRSSKSHKSSRSSSKKRLRRHSMESRGLVKLDFAHLPLYGRFQEKLSIITTLGRVGEAGASAEVIMLFAKSGAGKTALVNEALRDYKKAKQLLGRGKFEQSNLSNKPFAAVVEVFSTLIANIINQMGDDLQDDYPMSVKDALGDEAYRITTLIPGLVDLIGERPPNEDQQHPECDLTTFMRFMNLLRKMLRAICAYQTPVVLFFDDLHYADSDSLAIFKYLSNDPDITNLLVIGSFEDDESEGMDEVAVILEEIDQVKTKLIRLSNLNRKNINHLIADVMEMDPDMTKDLAKVVYKRSDGGNAFFVIQFLELIQQLGLLTFDVTTKQWAWSKKKIKEATNHLENGRDSSYQVQHVVSARISHLPHPAKLILSTAACLGSSLLDLKVLSWLLKDKNLRKISESQDGSTRTLDSASNFMSAMMASFRGLESDGNPESDIRESLIALERIGMVDAIDVNHYRFAHDRIQLGAYFLLSEGSDRNRKHWKTGHYLKQLLEKRILEDDWLFFTMVDQMNKGSSCIKEEEERLELASLNLRAAYKAKERSAFTIAARYAYSGMELLGDQSKSDMYHSLFLKLLTAAAEMGLSSGDNESSLDVTEEALEHANSLEEKIPVYFLRIKCLMQSGNPDEGVKIALDVLGQLGENFTSMPTVVNAVFNLTNLKGTVKGRSDEVLLQLPRMTDETQLITMQLLALASHCAAKSNKKEYVPLFRSRIFHLVLKHGMCEESVLAYTGYGILNATHLNGYEDAYRFGHLGMQLQQLVESSKYDARVAYEFYGFTHHIKEPIRQSLVPLQQSYKRGIRYGTIEDALFAASIHCIHYFFSGRPLNQLSYIFKDCLSLMREYTPSLYLSMIPFGQLVKNLMGKAPNTSILNGDILDLEEATALIDSTTDTPALRNLLCAQVELASWFRQYPLALQLLQEIHMLKPDPDFPSRFASRRLLFYECLVNIGMARSDVAKGPYLKVARASVKKMQKYAAQGSVDCSEMLEILEAEILSLNPKANSMEVMKAYQQAISSAVSSRAHHNTALANELAGRYLMSIDDVQNGMQLLQQAHLSYSEWNAYEKAHDLVKSFPDLEKESEVVEEVDPLIHTETGDVIGHPIDTMASLETLVQSSDDEKFFVDEETASANSYGESSSADDEEEEAVKKVAMLASI